MFRLRTILFTLFCVCIGGCDFAIKDKIIDNYYLIAADMPDQLNLDYHEPSDGNYGTLIDATVFAVGFNDKYIIVKQHPRTFPEPPNKNITNYFILPLKKGMNWKDKNGMIGPLTLQQFNEKRLELNITDELEFSIKYEDLE